MDAITAGVVTGIVAVAVGLVKVIDKLIPDKNTKTVSGLASKIDALGADMSEVKRVSTYLEKWHSETDASGRPKAYFDHQVAERQLKSLDKNNELLGRLVGSVDRLADKIGTSLQLITKNSGRS